MSTNIKQSHDYEYKTMSWVLLHTFLSMYRDIHMYHISCCVCVCVYKSIDHKQQHMGHDRMAKRRRIKTTWSSGSCGTGGSRGSFCGWALVWRLRDRDREKEQERQRQRERKAEKSERASENLTGRKNGKREVEEPIQRKRERTRTRKRQTSAPKHAPCRN